MNNIFLNHFDEQVASDLEFDIVRTMLAKKCVQPSARNRANSLCPLKNRKTIIKLLEETEESKRIRIEGNSFPSIDFEELDNELKILEVKDSVLSEEGFWRISRASHLTNSILKGLKETLNTPRLNSLAKYVYFTKDIVDPIDKVFDAKGQVKDKASKKLSYIREDMVSLKRSSNRNFSKAMKRLFEKGWLSDIKEGFVNERRVLAIDSTYKRRVKGNVLGSSNTGTITFIEPYSVVSINHELEILRDDERKEVRKILRDLTRTIREHLELVMAYNKLLVELDFVWAKASLAIELECNLPALAKSTGLKIFKAYHPLLVEANRDLGLKTHPQVLLHKEMLHRYSDISVMTIDKFVNRLVKSFARDLALEQDYRIEIDANKVLEEAVSQLLEKLGSPGNKDLTSLLKSFALNKVDDDQDAGVRRPLTQLGRTLMQEKMSNVIKLLSNINPKDFKRISDELRIKNISLEKDFYSKVDLALEKVKSLNIPEEDFPKTGNIFKILYDLRYVKIADPTTTFNKIYNDPMLLY